MGFNGVGGGNMNITIQLGGTQGSTSGNNNGGFQGMQIRFDSANDRLSNDKGDQNALQDLRNLNKDVDAALQKEEEKEMQDMMMELLGMIMDLLKEVTGDEDGGSGGGDGKCKGGSKSHGQDKDKSQDSGLQVQITF